MNNRYSLLQIVFVVALALLVVPALRGQTATSYADVMLLVNDRSSASVEVGNYFAQRRGIPDWHICHINVDSSESMDSATFIPVKWQIQAWMASRNLVDSINYIVTTKGCPLRVRTVQGDNPGAGVLGGLASFEDCLVLINGSDSTRMLETRGAFYGSRYFGSTKHFKRDPATLPMYLVTRLDAYTIDQIKSYIRRAETPVVLGEGLWVIDLDPGRENPGYAVGNQWLRDAATKLKAKGLDVFYDTTDTYVHNKQNVVGYGSWGSNDGHSGGGAAAIPGNTWVNGSIAETIVSTGGRSFTTGTGYGQSLVADWLAEGVCAVKGYTDEPYLTSIAHFDIVFDRYTSGFNMAESYYAGSQLMAWRQVVIGDPKMHLGQLLALEGDALDVGSGGRYAPVRDTVMVRNSAQVPVELTSFGVGGGDSLDFTAELPSGEIFPRMIASGDSAAVIVTLVPTVYRRETTTLRLNHRRSGETREFVISLALSGTGTRPGIRVTDTVNFGSPAGSTPVTRPAQVTNLSASDTLVVTALSISGTDRAQFRVDSSVTLPHAIPPGERWGIDVIYQPSGMSGHIANLNVSSNAGAARVVRLVGTSNTSSVDYSHPTPTGGAITGIAPNPLRGLALVSFRTTAERSRVRCSLLDVQGRVVQEVDGGMVSAGENSLRIDAGGLPNGSYLCRLVITIPGGDDITLIERIVVER